jgi:hypothetical protein
VVFTPVIIELCRVNDNWKTTISSEYYQEQSGISIPTTTVNGLNTAGTSLNLNYVPTQNISCRIEGRWINSKDKTFETASDTTNNNVIIDSSTAIKFA